MLHFDCLDFNKYELEITWTDFHARLTKNLCVLTCGLIYLFSYQVSDKINHNLHC